jgi:DNA modification methylase
LLEQRIHLVNTDPPYNVKVEPRSNNAIAAGLSSYGNATHHQRFDAERRSGAQKPTNTKMRAKDRPLLNDFLPEAEFEQLLLAWFGNINRALVDGGTF